MNETKRNEWPEEGRRKDIGECLRLRDGQIQGLGRNVGLDRQLFGATKIGVRKVGSVGSSGPRLLKAVASIS